MTASSNFWLQDIPQQLAALDAAALRRTRRTVAPLQGARILVDGQPMLQFCSNDYLGLAQHPAMIEAACAGAQDFGVGSGGSPMVNGHSTANAALEEELARFVQLPRALYFYAGFATNASIIPALVGAGDAIFSDALNHASLIDGCRLSRGQIHRFEHGDLAALEQAKSSLRGEKIPFDENIEIGGMIEVPAAALAIGVFLRRLDFISIGTNDLIQYTLAIDRTDEQVANLYDPLHPSIMMLLSHIISSAEKANVPVSMCGEMAGDPLFTRLLLGMGLRQFSMYPAQVPAVKQRIKQSDISEIEPIVRRIVRLEESAKIEEQIERLNALQQ